MARKGTQAYRNVVAGLILPITLAGCFMNDPVEPAAASDTSPPSGANNAPDIWGNAPRVVKVGVNYSFTPQATDPDGDHLTFRINKKPIWVTFDSSNGNISGVPKLGHEGTYNDVEISVSDGLAQTTLTPFSVSVEPNTAPNMPPEIDGTPGTSVTVGDSYSFTPTGSDPDGDPLTYSVLNMPGWASFSTLTGELSGTPQASDIAVHAGIAITVNDGTLSSSLPAFSINVVAANSAPQISGAAATTVTVGQSYIFTPTAFDADGGRLTFSIQNMPGWAQFDSATGTLSGTPQIVDAGSYADISISVSDGDLNDALPAFTITVNQVSLGSATLSWTPPTQNTDGTPLMDLAGYKIYYGTSPGNYPNQITINNPGVTTYVVDNLAPNTWYFVSTSLNSSGMESDFSNVATRTIN